MPSTTATATPMSIDQGKPRPSSSPARTIAKAAVPARANVAREIWPTNPVRTITDRAMIAAIDVKMMALRQSLSSV